MKIYIFLLSFLSFAGCSETPQVQSAPWLDQLKNEEFEGLFKQQKSEPKFMLPSQVSNFIVKTNGFQNEKDTCKYLESWADQHLTASQSPNQNYYFYYDHDEMREDNPFLEQDYPYLFTDNILCKMNQHFICYGCYPQS